VALPFTDTFQQTSGSAQAIATYNASYVAAAGGFSVPNNAGYVEATTGGIDNIARWDGDTPNADQMVWVVMGSNIASGYWIGPVGRLQTGAVTGYAFYSNGASNELHRFVSGSPTLLESPSATWASGDVCRMKVTGTGATVTITIEKALAASPTSFSTVVTHNDTTGNRVTTAGRGGFIGYGNMSGAGLDEWGMDNIAATSQQAPRSMHQFRLRRR
jgi:hypothetical protein